MSFSTMRGRVEHIFIAHGHKYWGTQGPTPEADHPMRAVGEARCRAGLGIEGDRFSERAAGHKSQITFYSWEVHEELRAAFGLPHLSPDALRRNVVVSGLDLPSLVGQKFRVQDIYFDGVMECSPCKWMDVTIAPGARAWLAKNGRGGLRAKIVTGGILQCS